MASAKTLSFEKAIEYMDPMQVTDCLHKTLDFLLRNNSELYFPSISPYVEAFLVNLVTDTRNLTSKLFKYENKNLASEIIKVLETSRDVFRWTHSYENGNLFVYKKIFSNKMNKKPAKTSSIAYRLLQAQTQSTPNVHHASPVQANTCRHAPESTRQPDLPVASTGFKLRFLHKTLAFIKDDTEFTLLIEMLSGQADYVYSLITSRATDVGFGYKSLYAPLWEAMEVCSMDYEIEVTLAEASSSGSKVVILEKVPKHKSKKPQSRQAAKKEAIPVSINNTSGLARKQDPNSQAHEQSVSITSPALPRLELLSSISERFFVETVRALTAFARDAARASLALCALTSEQIAFVKRVKSLAESCEVLEMFSAPHRASLRALHRGVERALQTCTFTTTVDEKHRSITLKKTPRFASPLPVVSAAFEQRIQFQRGDKLPATGNVESPTEAAPRAHAREGAGSGATEAAPRAHAEGAGSGHVMGNRKAKLLEDLSTPLDSDRGIRMMRLMGWSGGALGARGDGIMEPVMPAIDLPKKAGLGHVPPPKPAKAPPRPPQAAPWPPQAAPLPPNVTPRRPLDFRLTFLHGMYDLLLHGETRKEIQLGEPLIEKERNFIRSALGSLNDRRRLELTAAERAPLARVAGELAGRPGLQVGAAYSRDLRTVTLVKITHQAAVTLPRSALRPAPSGDVIAAPSGDVIAAPSGDVIAAPSGDVIAAPSGDVIAAPSGDVIAAPSGDVIAAPSGDVIAAPSGDVIAAPSGDVIAAPSGDVIAAPSGDVTAVTNVLVTDALVRSVLPHVQNIGTKVSADKKAVRKRALRLVFLVKLAEALQGGQWGLQSRIVFKFDFLLPKKLKLFMHSIVGSLNRGGWHAGLLGWETAVYEDLREVAWGTQLALEALPGSIFVFTRTPIITKDSLLNAEPSPRDNEDDNRNQITNVNDYTEHMHVDTDNSNKENNASQRLIEAIVKTTSNLKDAISNINSNNKDDHFTSKSNDDGLKVTSIQESNTAGPVVDNIQHNITDNVNVKDVNLNKIEVDSRIPTEIENTEGVPVKSESECDISGPDVKSKVNLTNGVTEAKVKVCDISELSDWDRNIQGLEMSFLKADLNCVLKEETDTDSDFEMAISETDLNMNIKKEKDTDYLNTKKSHSSSACSQELDPKKVKICDETDENVVIIRPTLQNEKMTEDLVKQVQTLMANELDKAGGFLPLLKCHGVQNGGLVYSCHDEDDVAWLKKVASAANLAVEPVLRDVCLAKKSREVLIRIGSSIPLDGKKMFRKFEIYNVGLNTKYWKVSHKHTATTFTMFLVTVDEKSFKYICDAKFSLYCGIDKAQFSIIY